MLNEALYQRLKKRFGEVKVWNRGQKFVYRVIDDELKIEHWGETYAVCCPFCNDTNFHLCISHMYMQVEPITGRRLSFLAKCFHDCKLTNLATYIFGPMYLLRRKKESFIQYKPIYLTKQDERSENILDYGLSINVWELPEDHIAVRYLYDRGVDKAKMQIYNLKYCVDHRNTIVKNRIIMPVSYHGEYVGWVSRSILPSQEPRYYNPPGFKKSEHFYALDLALDYKFLILVEGPFDAIAVGPPAIATFSKVEDLTLKQKMKLLPWRNKPILIMFDGDIHGRHAAVELHKNLTRKGDFDQVYIIPLPQDKDPADMRDSIWDHIQYYVNKYNINFSTV